MARIVVCIDIPHGGTSAYITYTTIPARWPYRLSASNGKAFVELYEGRKGGAERSSEGCNGTIRLDEDNPNSCVLGSGSSGRAVTDALVTPRQRNRVPVVLSNDEMKRLLWAATSIRERLREHSCEQEYVFGSG
ncbi:MAG: hypothetical protein AAF658_12140, partial [Myxococcota bacterium]